MNRRSLVALVALAATGLTACGASAPPANELAIELIDSLEADGTLTADQAGCMRDRVGEYTGEELDDLAERADSNNAEALEGIQKFERDLRACRAAG